MPNNGTPNLKSQGRANTLPSPARAKKMAEATGRVVAGSDGRYHTPMPDDEVREYEKRRNRTYSVIDAINGIAAHSGMTPEDWLQGADAHWLTDLTLSDIENAAEWLKGLAATFCDGPNISGPIDPLTTKGKKPNG